MPSDSLSSGIMALVWNSGPVAKVVPRAHGLLHRELGAHRGESVPVPAGPAADARVLESLPRGAAHVGRAHRGAALRQSPLAQLYFAAYQEVSGIPEVLDKVLDDFDEGLGAERPSR